MYLHGATLNQKGALLVKVGISRAHAQIPLCFKRQVIRGGPLDLDYDVPFNAMSTATVSSTEVIYPKGKMNVDLKCHTPFCRKDCIVAHHDLIRALCIERNRKESKPSLSSSGGNSHVLLRQCIHLYEGNGWDRNSVIPDDLPELQQPLLYLTCAFGKHRVLETLLNMRFDPTVVTKDGENGLHGLVNHFYRVGNMKQCGGFMVIEKRLEVFQNVVNTLSRRDPNVFSAKDTTNGRTPLHVVAMNVISCTSRHARVDGRCDPLKKTRYFQRCLELMLGHLLELKETSLITSSQLTNAIMAQDNDGNTIMHILAKSSCLPSWESIGKVLKMFPESELPLLRNNDSKTPFDLLSSLNVDVARKLFFPSDFQDGKVYDGITGKYMPPEASQVSYWVHVSLYKAWFAN